MKKRDFLHGITVSSERKLSFDTFGGFTPSNNTIARGKLALICMDLDLIQPRFWS